MSHVPDTGGSSLKEGLLVAAGAVSVAVGAVGIFLPLLPTTPFLLVAAACFARSSERRYQWLMSHRVFGPYIRNYHEHGAVTRHAKIVTLGLLWGTMSITAFVFFDSVVLRVILLAIAGGVTVHILRMKTAPADTECPPEEHGEGES
jgi:uncharacterized membrane protein YbaN (DUF454 family)